MTERFGKKLKNTVTFFGTPVRKIDQNKKNQNLKFFLILFVFLIKKKKIFRQSVIECKKIVIVLIKIVLMNENLTKF